MNPKDPGLAGPEQLNQVQERQHRRYSAIGAAVAAGPYTLYSFWPGGHGVRGVCLLGWLVVAWAWAGWWHGRRGVGR